MITVNGLLLALVLLVTILKPDNIATYSCIGVVLICFHYLEYAVTSILSCKFIIIILSKYCQIYHKE